MIDGILGVCKSAATMCKVHEGWGGGWAHQLIMMHWTQYLFDQKRQQTGRRTPFITTKYIANTCAQYPPPPRPMYNLCIFRISCCSGTNTGPGTDLCTMCVCVRARPYYYNRNAYALNGRARGRWIGGSVGRSGCAWRPRRGRSNVGRVRDDIETYRLFDVSHA